MDFENNATAGTATFTIASNGLATFINSALGGSATMTNNAGGRLEFHDTAGAATANITNQDAQAVRERRTRDFSTHRPLAQLRSPTAEGKSRTISAADAPSFTIARRQLPPWSRTSAPATPTAPLAVRRISTTAQTPEPARLLRQ